MAATPRHVDLTDAEPPADLNAGTDVIPFDPDENFWNRRPALAHIKQYAEAGEANPWATLGAVLVRITHQVPPRILMPGRNGTETGTRSLNMFVALIGPSGAGKKTATDAARLAIDVGDTHPPLPIGSGEGIAKAFRRPLNKADDGKAVVIDKDQVIKTTKAIFDVAEVSSWNALTGRQGGTLTSEVLKGFSGETLGFTNSDETRTVTVPADSYRMGLIIGAQPGACGPLLANEEAGLPQRFLWMPATEENEYDYHNMPQAPKQRRWKAPTFPAAGHTIHLPESIKEKVFYEGRELRKDPMESQAIVIKMRVAVCMALLDSRLKVNDEDWELAGMVMTVSRRTRTDVLKRIKTQQQREALRRGQLTAVSRHAEQQARDVLDVNLIRTVANRLVAILEAEGKPMLRNPLRTKLKADRRSSFDPALRLLIDEKRATVQDIQGRGGGTQRVALRK